MVLVLPTRTTSFGRPGFYPAGTAFLCAGDFMQFNQFEMTISDPDNEDIQAFANRVDGEWVVGATLVGKVVLGSPAASVERTFKQCIGQVQERPARSV